MTLAIEAAFGSDPDDPAPSWTDITDYVRAGSTRRGKKRDIDRVTAGQCVLELDNRDRRFEAGYTGGPYGSDVRPMVPIRIRVTRNAVTYPVFYGYADEWVPSLDAKAPNEAVVRLRATDGFKVLAIVKLDQSVWEHVVKGDSPYVWYRMNEQATSQGLVDRANGLDGFYVNEPTSTAGLVDYDDDPARRFRDEQYAQTNNIGTSGDMTVECWLDLDGQDMGIQQGVIVRQLSVAGDQWALTFTGPDPAATLIGYSFFHTAGGSVTSGDLSPGRHHVVCTHDSGTSTIYVNSTAIDTDAGAVAVDPDGMEAVTIARLGLGFDALTYSFWPHGVIDEVAIYTSALSAAQVLEHYAAAVAPRTGDLVGARLGWLLDLAGWPAGLRDLDTGQNTLGPVSIDGRTVLDLLWETVEYDDGRMYVARDGDLTFQQRSGMFVDTTSATSQATYSSGSNGRFGGVTFDYSDELIRNHAKITTANGFTYEAEDATSIGTYLRRTHEQKIPHSDTTHGQGLADWIVLTRKDPARRITALKVPTSRDAATFDATLNLELGYRITVTVDPPGTGTISDPVIVEGVDHDFTPHSWTSMLWCSPVPPVDVFIIGTDSIGGTAVIGY